MVNREASSLLGAETTAVAVTSGTTVVKEALSTVREVEALETNGHAVDAVPIQSEGVASSALGIAPAITRRLRYTVYTQGEVYVFATYFWTSICPTHRCDVETHVLRCASFDLN